MTAEDPVLFDVDPATDANLRRWVAAGLLTPGQADAIARHELVLAGVAPGPARPGAPAPQGRGPEGAEPGDHVPVGVVVLGYLGAALAVIAGMFLAFSVGEDLADWRGALVLAAVSAALGVAGLWLVRDPRDPFAGLGDFAWALSAGIGAGAVALFTSTELDWDGWYVALTASLTGLVLASVFWVRRRTALEQVAVFAALAATVSTTVNLVVEETDGVASPLAYGLPIWGLGIVWLILSWGGLVRPAWTATLLGVGAAYLGATITRGASDWWLLLAAATVASVLVVAVRSRSRLLLGLGVFGLFVFVPQLLDAALGDEAGPFIPLSLLVLGLGLLAVAVMRGRSRPGTGGAQ